MEALRPAEGDLSEPSTQDMNPEDLNFGDNCNECNFVIQDNWNCLKGCPDKRIREAFSKPVPHCLAAHNADSILCDRDGRSSVQEEEQGS